MVWLKVIHAKQAPFQGAFYIHLICLNCFMDKMWTGYMYEVSKVEQVLYERRQKRIISKFSQINFLSIPYFWSCFPLPLLDSLSWKFQGVLSISEVQEWRLVFGSTWLALLKKTSLIKRCQRKLNSSKIIWDFGLRD